MRRVTMILLLCLSFAPVVCGQQNRGEAKAQSSTPSTETLPTTDQILEKYIQALGGRTALEKLTSRMIVQSATRPEGELRVEIYEKAPNKRLVVSVIENSGKVQSGFDGVIGWTQRADGEVKELSEIELAEFKQNSEFYRDLKLKELFPKMSLKGKETISGRAAYLIEAPAANGRIEKMYFDVQNGLLIRRNLQSAGYIRQSDDEEPQLVFIDMQIDYEDYREVDGVKMPFLIKRSFGRGSGIIRVKVIRFNIEIDDAKFKKPAS